MIGGEQAHHDPGRAEPALRGVRVDHRLLQRMQVSALGEILDRDELGAVELAEQQDAGVERLVGERAPFKPRQDNGARAAISLGAALLCSPRSHVLPQPIEDGRAGGELGESDVPVPETKAQRVARARWSSLKRHDRC